MGPKELLPRSGAKVWEIFLKCLYGGVRQSGTKGGVVGKLWGGRGVKCHICMGGEGKGGHKKQSYRGGPELAGKLLEAGLATTRYHNDPSSLPSRV